MAFHYTYPPGHAKAEQATRFAQKLYDTVMNNRNLGVDPWWLWFCRDPRPTLKEMISTRKIIVSSLEAEYSRTRFYQFQKRSSLKTRLEHQRSRIAELQDTIDSLIDVEQTTT